MYNKKVLSKIDLGKQTKKDPFKGDIIYDSMGQWKFPGQPTRIPSNEITMEGVPYPVYGIDNTGYAQVMQPGADYTFPGDYVDEYPMAKKGGSLPKRPKKKNKRAWSRSIEATNILFTENPLFSQPKPRRNKVYDPNAKYYQKGGTKSKTKRTKLPTLYISDPEEYRLRKAMYDDSLYMYQQNNSTKLPPPPKLEYVGPTGASKHSPAKVTTDPIKKITNKNDTKKALLYSKAFPGDSPAFKNYQKKTGKKLPANLPMWIEKQTALYYPDYYYSNTNSTGKGFIPPGKDYVKGYQYRGLWKEPRQPVMFGKPESSAVTSNTYLDEAAYNKLHPPIYVSDPNDPGIGMYTEAGNQILYKKPVTSKKNALKLKPKVVESKIPISESAPVPAQVPVQTENVLPIQKPLRDTMVLPLGRYYSNEATDGSRKRGKTIYGQFEKVVDPRSGKIRYIPTGKKSNFTTLEDPTFKQGGKLGPISLNSGKYAAKKYPFGKFSGVFTKQDGGYIETELTDAEIEEYRKGGFIVEDISIPQLNQAQKGGTASCPEGYTYDSASNACVPTGEFEYVDDPNDARLQDYKMQDMLYRYSQLPYKHKRHLNPEYILSGDFDTSWNERLNDPYESDEEKTLLKNDLLGWEGSKAQTWNFNNKKQLQNFINSQAFSWTPDLARAWQTDQLKGLMEKYPPTGYHAREYFTSHPYMNVFAYNSNVPYKSGYSHYIKPKTAFIEDEVDREKLKKIYPTLTDDEIDQHLKERRETPSYITNYRYNSDNNWEIFNQDVETREDQVHPLVERITPEEMNNFGGSWMYESLPKKGADSYLQEAEADDVTYQGDYIPTWSAPKKKYILRKAVPKPVVSESTEDTTPTQMPLKDKMVLPLGRSYFNEGKHKEKQGGKTYYGEFEKIVDPKTGKIRYVPTGKKKEFITIEDPSFKSGGEMYEAQRGAVVISDPNEYKYRRAMYDDSLNLYKAYQFQKSHINPKPALQEFVNHYNQMRREYPEMRRPGDPRTLTVEQLMKTRKANFNRQLPKYSHKDYQQVKRNPRGGFDPMDRRTGDYAIYNYYKSLPFNNDVALGNYSSPDVWHSKINPSGSYFDGIAFSPKYKKPVEPVEFGESEVIESKPVLPEQVISESVQTENMLPVQLPQRDKMVMPLGRTYHHESAYDTSPEGGQEYYGEFEKIIDPRSGKVRYVPTGKKSKFRTLHDPTFQDGGEMYDASGLTPFIKAQTGLVATGEEDLYSAGELEPVTVKAEMPDWARFQEEYQNIKPLESYIAEEKKKYLRRGNKALNKMAGVTETNFPKDVEERFRQEYNQKMNTYATRKLGKKQGFNPRRRGEWVDELSPREFDVVAQSKYGSKLSPNAWSRFLSGAQGAANTLMIGQPVNFDIPGFTKREMKEARENPWEAFELLALQDIPGIAIANKLTNANIENPSIMSGETMANVNPLATVGVNPLLALDLAGIPSLAKGIYTGTKALGKGTASLGKKAAKVTGNTLQEYLMQQKGKSYKPRLTETTNVPTEAELKRLSEIEKAQSVKAYHFRKKEAPIPEYYNSPEEYEAAIDQYNTNLKAVQNYVKTTDLPEDEIRDIFGREREEILNLKLETPTPVEQRLPQYDDLDYGDYDPDDEYFNSLVDEPPISSYRRPTVPSQVTRRGERPEDLDPRARGYNSVREIVDDIPAQMNQYDFQAYDAMYSQLLTDLRRNPQAYDSNARAAINELGNIISRPNVVENFNPDVIADSGSGLRVPQSLQEPLMRLENKANAPVSGSDIRTAYQEKEAIPALDPNARNDVKQLVTSFFADRFDSPKEALKYITGQLDKGVKESKVGDVVTGSTNTSHDSYKIQMDYIFKNAGKEGLSEPVFLGYEPMNNFGFLSKTKSVSNEDIYKRINAHLNSLQKRTGKSINLKSHPPILNTNEFGETIVMLPQYGLRKIGETTGKLKKKQEGGIVSELTQKEIDDLIAQGYTIEEV